MKRIILSLSDELLVKLDVYCTSNGYSRAELVRLAIRDKVSPGHNEFVVSNGEPYVSTAKPMPLVEKNDVFKKLKEQLEVPHPKEDDFYGKSEIEVAIEEEKVIYSKDY